jgi:hypothetical protein
MPVVKIQNGVEIFLFTFGKNKTWKKNLLQIQNGGKLVFSKHFKVLL